MTKEVDKKVSKLAQKLKKSEKVELFEPLIQDGKDYTEVHVRVLTLKERMAMETDESSAYSPLNGDVVPKIEVQLDTLAFALYAEGDNGSHVKFDRDVIQEMNSVDFDSVWSAFLQLTLQYVHKLPKTSAKQ